MNRAVLCAALCIGCTGAGADRAGVVTRDSAGISITESVSPAWGEGAGWRLTDAPLVRIGSVAGEPESELYQVTAVARLSDGRIVVVNSGSQQVRVFGDDGGYLDTFGGSGEGPGEFRYPRSLWVLANDTLLVADLDRFSYFDRDYRFVRSEPFGRRMPRQRLSDGTFVGMGYASGQDYFEPGQLRPLYAVIRTLPDDSQDTLSLVPGDDVFRIRSGNGISQWIPPFGLRRLLVAHDMSLYTGDGSAFEVAVLDTAGTVTRIMRRPDVERAVTSDMVERWRESQLALAPSDRRDEALRTIVREAKLPARRPAWDALLVDAPGDVWIRHYALDRGGPSTWSVFDPDGRWLGEVGMPASFEVREIGAEYVLGVRTDELGVEYVERYGILKD